MSFDTKLCPYCSEEIKVTAIKCKHCGERLDSSSPPVPGGAPATAVPIASPSARTAAPGAQPGAMALGEVPRGTRIGQYVIDDILGAGGMG